MDIDRADLMMLLHIHQQGSLSGAALALDLAPTVVSKRLAALESRLAVRLLHRTTRRLRFTPEGEAFVQQAADLAAGFERLEESLAGRRDDARGRLRVACSFGFGRIWLAPLLAQLQARHPGLSIDLQLSADLPDLTGGGFDAAVWLWQPQGTRLVTRRLAHNRRVVVAAPRYLAHRGVPTQPEDLLMHDCLLVRENIQSPTLWELQTLPRRGATPRSVRVRVQGMLCSNHGEVVREWALQGHGLMLRSLWDVYAALADGSLVQVLPDWAMQDADVQLVLPPRDPRLAPPRRVKLLQEHLAASLADPPWAAALSPRPGQPLNAPVWPAAAPAPRRPKSAPAQPPRSP